ncbi:MAG: TonB-dependent receptor, partial [Bryobacteraceae bacterium]
MKRLATDILVFLAVSVGCGSSALAQSSSGTVHGTVLDPSGAVIAGAVVTIENPVSHYSRSAVSDSQGRFEFGNLPANNYHLSAVAAGFQAGAEDINIRSAVPLELKIALALGKETQTVTVESGQDLVESTSTTHTDVDRDLFDKLPLESSSSSLSSLVTLASPGISADSNGLFHGFGDHASNSFSLDGEPITDQQSKVFSNQIPLDSVQSMEVIAGAPPAEYGDKTSVVIVVTTRSGLGQTQPHGDITASYGSFGTGNAGFNLGYGGQNWGNFISASGMNTGRFLDGPEFQVFHDHGNEENFFDRLDFKPSAANTLNLNLGFTRSWFQTPNSYDGQDATAWSGLVVDNNGLGPNGFPVGPTDQRSQIRTFNVAPTWTRIENARTVVTFGGFLRQDQFNYYPSDNPFSDLQPDLQLQTIGQNRTLTSAGLRATLSYVNGIHNLKAGITYEDTILTEKDSIGIVDPTLNAVCLNADGSPYTGAGLTDPAQCAGPLTPNPSFSSLLACYDLTRTAALPASDHCPNSTSGSYHFYGHANVREPSAFIEDTITKKNWTFNLGVRFDYYDGLVTANQVEPRMGIAYNVKQTGTVLRISYARSLETPFNENLVLSSEGCNNPVINALMSSTISPCVSNV